MTPAERKHLDRVCALGCIVCRRPAEIHHPRNGVGMGRKSSHFDAIPLCPDHHRIGGFGVAIHAGQKTWEKNFGTEKLLLAKVRLELGLCEDGSKPARASVNVKYQPSMP